MGRDFQKQRVYDWEDKIIAPRDHSKVPYPNIQAIVDHCWPTPHPPRVQPLPPNSRKLGTGHRLRLRFPQTTPTPTWVILHELAHALTYGDGHGPQFVGAYCHLVNRFLGVPLPLLYATARASNVKYSASPVYNFEGEYL